jgi:hypothetical protein
VEPVVDRGGDDLAGEHDRRLELHPVHRDAGPAPQGLGQPGAQPGELGDRAQEERRRPLGAAGPDEIAHIDDGVLAQEPEPAVAEHHEPHPGAFPVRGGQPSKTRVTRWWPSGSGKGCSR